MEECVEGVLVKETIPDHYKCPICFGPMISAVSLVPCGHSLCQRCHSSNTEKNLTTGDRCFCKQKITNVIANYSVREGVGKLAATCSYCHLDKTLEGVIEHVKECAEKPARCVDCWQKMSRGNLEKHLCPKAVMTCECGFNVQRLDMEQHKNKICPQLLAVCPLGCEKEVKRNEMVDHMSGCANLAVKCKVPGCGAIVSSCTSGEHNLKEEARHSELLMKERRDMIVQLYQNDGPLPKLKTEGTKTFKWTKTEETAEVSASPEFDAFGSTWRIVHHRGELIQLECLRCGTPNNLWNVIFIVTSDSRNLTLRNKNTIFKIVKEGESIAAKFNKAAQEISAVLSKIDV